MAKKGSKTSYFTNRGQHFGNAWSVYSYKTSSSYRLCSDLALGHWLCFLEFDQEVKTFELYPAPRLILNPKPHQISFDAEVSRFDGSLEWHLLVSAERQKDESFLNALDEHAHLKGATLRLFGIDEIMPMKYKIMPLLRVSACLSVGRNTLVSYSLLEEASAIIRTKTKGNLREFLTALNTDSEDIACFLFAKMYAEGLISVELNPYFFSYDAEWVLR
ncbi:hypothetical protein SAMN05216605_102499 [Pseudomonas abietaniphila]|uniref:TnsA endonuclease N terminal n=1 Tax=Pseudomonas abietaniphila TaxID=89065 RepID=A0A1G7VH01_9PSED|nr:hypothetical protein SAMN05216605_102499 [Pseudomonas abietaniphila]